MPRTETRLLYQYSELDEKAQARARDWYRALEAQDFDHGYVYDDAQRMAELLGITIGTRPYRTVGGDTRQQLDIRFSGFSSQGDGASFVGTYQYRKGASKAIRAEAPKDTQLHAIADVLQAIQRAHGYQLTATIEDDRACRYSHEYSVDVFVSQGDARLLDADVVSQKAQRAADGITEGMRDFMRWIYRQLEQEYDYRQSDEAIAEGLIANEYEFTEAGGHVG